MFIFHAHQDRKSPFLRSISLLLAMLMLTGTLLGTVSCVSDSEGADTQTQGETEAASNGSSAGNESEAEATETETEYDPFVGVNYKDRPFRILTSTNAASAGMGNSNYLIEGEDLAEPTILNDAVMTRNSVVEDKLGVKLEFTQLDVPYTGVFDKIRSYVMSGTDEYDLVINDLYPFANLSIEGNFQNVYDPSFTGFDFEDKSYWYKEYMDDLCLYEGYQFLLAGDYFIDIVRSAHLLLFNKSLYDIYHGDGASTEVYEWVLNYEWTYEKMLEMITNMYVDKDDSGDKNKGDQFGFSILELWGSSIGFAVSADPHFVTRDEFGMPTISLGEDSRAADLTDWLTKLAYADDACFGLTSDEDILADFTNRLSLICDYQRLGSLENAVLNEMKDDRGVLPYPMLYASDRQYNTATHDTTELGAILKTSPTSSREFVSTVIQVLNRETANLLMNKYYEEALKVRYVSDPYDSQMVDIIHDNIRHSFILAYNNRLNSVVLNVFSNAVADKREFEVTYKSSQKSVNKAMSSMLKLFKKKNNID